MSRRWSCRWAWDFFGLTPNDKIDVIYEPAFLLVYYGGLTLADVFTMPVEVKRWWIERLTKELGQKEDGENAPLPASSRALHQNSPEVRSMQGMNRAQVPSRLRRFT